MDRLRFLQSLALIPLAGAAMNLRHLHKVTEPFEATDKMPVLFLGHGSPMNAIQDTEFSRGWRTIGQSLPRPNAIICISAHWETKGTYVTAMEKPKTIHDFGGFPQELFDVQYPAPGSPAIAQQTKETITSTEVGLDQQWGLDHGTWSVVKHLYPKADVPVIQLSLDYTKGPQYHFELAKELASLRKKGVLIIGSGNIVHNLGIIDWQNQDRGFDWAIEANTTMKSLITKGDYAPLINYTTMGKAFQLSIPTPEHYLPMLYTLGLKDDKDALTIFNDKTIMGSIAMTSLMIG
ncbi:MAG: 4,5-DOPA dioxygenase extradiol [Saprospiraceae bacterium]|nr:4,5-DOPA dioxygenase extradiol [Candidatus Opimibacter iunctus]